MRRAFVASIVAAAAAAVFAPGAFAGAHVVYGVQDDAWLTYGAGTLDTRLATLDRLGIDVYRYTLHWDQLEPRQTSFRWQNADAILRGLQAHGIQPVVTIYGAPRWANGGHAPNFAPRRAATFAAFARAAARRYPFVRYWTVWNEPNQRISLRPASPKVYVRTLLNPAYAAIHAVLGSRAKVAGGMTAPRGNTGGVAPLTWVQGMRAAHARLDAYAHHPYPTHPSSESPSAGACGSCGDITMANLPRLIAAVGKAFGPKPIWLTEYGYQTNPPDRLLGVSRAMQARYVAEAAQRSCALPRGEMRIHFRVRGEPVVGRWQSGLFDAHGVAKPALRAYSLPLVQLTRSGSRATLWGQVRPGRGAQAYRLHVVARGRRLASVKAGRTTARGFLRLSVSAPRGSLVTLCTAGGQCGWPVLLR